jgi:hypothetical protein
MSYVGDLMGEPDRAALNLSVSKDAGVIASSKHLTELDISKIVALKYAKNAQYSEDKPFSAIVKEEFRNIYKVWSAFAKFIRSQATGKQKMVDTTFIGHILKRDDEPVNSSNLELLVSQDFYEAGKFKNK